jgi:ribonuclease Z
MNEQCDFKVTLLGTGTPIPSKDRFGPCTLIEAGSQKLLIDAGRGSTIRLAQLDIPIGRIDALFLTHFHSDHTVGVPDLWLTGWLESHFGMRQKPLRVIGPRGTEALMVNLRKAYADDIRIRMEDEKLGAEGVGVLVEEYASDSLVYEEEDVKITAFEVDHGDAIKPAYGYCIEYKGRRAVISGDTRYNQNVIKYGAGADLLIHEVVIARPELLSEPYIQRIVAHHTTASEAGTLFTLTGPELAVFTHIVFLASKEIPPATIDELIAETRRTYHGPLEVGQDLMCLEIGTTVTVNSTKCLPP